MRDFGSKGFILLIGTLVLGASTSSAWAYLDPGTGSIILQVLLGGVAGLLLAGKLYWHKLLTTLRIRRDEAEPHDNHSQQIGADVDVSARK